MNTNKEFEQDSLKVSNRKIERNQTVSNTFPEEEPEVQVDRYFMQAVLLMGDCKNTYINIGFLAVYGTK